MLMLATPIFAIRIRSIQYRYHALVKRVRAPIVTDEGSGP